MTDISFIVAFAFFWLFAVLLLIDVVGKKRKKKTNGFKEWLKVYWSELVFILCILLSIFFVLKGAYII